MHPRRASLGSAVGPTRRTLARRVATGVALSALLVFACRREARTHLDSGDRLLALGRAKRAIVEYQAAYEIDPSAHAHRGLGLSYEALGALTRAQQHLQAAVEARPSDLETRVALARVRGSFGQYAEARRELLAALEVAPHDEAALLLLGIYAQERPELTQARELIGRALMGGAAEKRPATRASGLVLADLLEQSGNEAAAERLRRDAHYAPPERPRLTLELAKASQGRGNFRLTQQLLQPLLERQDDPVGWQLLAAASLELGEYKTARSALEHLHGHAQDPEVRLLEARWHVANGFEAAPVLELRALLELVPPDQEHERARIRRFLADALRRQRKLDEAQRELSLLLAERPHDVEGRLALAELHLARANAAEAVRVLAALPAQQGQLTRAQELLGRALLESGETSAAEATFRRLCERAPFDPKAVRLLALSLERKGETERAREVLEAGLDRFPEATENILALARSIGKLRGRQAALSFVNAHAERYPKSAAVAHAKAKWLMAEGDVARGLDAYRQTLLLDAGRTAAALELALVHAHHDKTELARAVLDGALAHDPDHLEAYLLAARVSSDAAQYREGRDYCQRALDSHPGHPRVLALLAEILAEGFGAFEQAAKLASSARAAAPDHPEVLDAVGWVAQLQGKSAGAVPYLERAVRAAPDNARIRYHLGAALLGAGQEQASREQLARVLSLDPVFPKAKAIKSLLAARR